MKATVTVTFDIPETGDLCWTPDGIQCLHDSVIRPALRELTRRQALADDESLKQFIQHKIDVLESLTITGVTK